MTFVGKSFAKKGFRFYFKGKHLQCPKTCRFYATCQENLEPNYVYEVIEVTDRIFKCPEDFHEEEMVLVRVKKALINISIPTKEVFIGALMNYSKIKCEFNSCPYFENCVPSDYLIHSNTKVKIIESVKKIKDCKKNLKLTIVKVEKVE